MRTCLGCRRRHPKKALLRLARGADGVVTIDEGGDLAGRGAYVCRDAACAERLVRGGRLGYALRAPCRVDAALVERVASLKWSLRR